MTHVVAPAWSFTTGPRDAKVVVVAEAQGEQEALTGQTLIGSSGQEFTRMMAEVGLDRWKCLCTSVFAFRPMNNNLATICGKKADGAPGLLPFGQGKYLRPEFVPELDRLWEEILAHPRNLIIALGATATWALLDNPRINSCRGYVGKTTRVPAIKVLPTYHPSYVLRDWSKRPIVLADLAKAKRESETDVAVRPARYILVDPTLEEIAEWFSVPTSRWSVDIETKKKTITYIGFARSTSEAMVIPFTRPGRQNYWPTLEDEIAAWGLVRRALERSDVEKVFQNGLYDLQYLYRMGIRPQGCYHDTMLRHHALFPEVQKGLEFLGSVYTDEASWKPLRKLTPTKRDE